MKRLGIILIVLILSIALIGCAEQQTTYTVNKNGMELRVDIAQKTISDGNHIYHYEFSGDSSSFSVTITYPNGSSYWYNQSDGGGVAGWSGDYVEGTYVSGDALVEVVREKAPKKMNPGKIVGGLMLMALGLIDVIAPKVSWYFGYGWRYKNAEPSDIALTFARIAGGIAVGVGVVLLLT